MVTLVMLPEDPRNGKPVRIRVIEGDRTLYEVEVTIAQREEPNGSTHAVVECTAVIPAEEVDKTPQTKPYLQTVK